MVTPYHSIVERGIVLLGKEWKKKHKVKEIKRGNENPLSIVDYQSKYVVNYKPDVYFILRNNKKLIFEVLDSEEEKQDIIIADVIRSFLVESVDAIIFVYSGERKIEKRIMEGLVTISKGLVYKGMPEKNLPFSSGTFKSGTLPVPRVMATSPESVKNILLEKFEKEN